MSRARGGLAVLYLLLFFSGASGLAFEIVWLRAIGLSFGTSVPALTTVLAAFMAGIALGSVLFGRAADAHPRPFVLYARLELGIGVCGALISLLLLRGSAILWPLARLSSGAPLLRAAIFFLLLMVPTTLMGGTLPTLSRALARAGVSGRAVGMLYAVNTFGAVLGALSPDFLLVPSLGLTQTALLAAMADLAVALAAMRLALPADPPAPPPPEPRAARIALFLFGASGFCAMGYELIWSRLLEHLSAGRITGFSLLLAVYLLAVAAGSRLAAGRADRSARPIFVAALLLCASGAATFALVVLLPRWGGWVGHPLQADPALVRAAPSAESLQALLISAFLETVPCLAMGAALPYLAAGAVPPGGAGRATGRLYALNTLLGVAGAAVTGFILLPLLGTQRALQGLCAIAVMAGAIGATAVGQGSSRRALPVVAGLLLCGLGFMAPRDLLRSMIFPYSAPELVSVLEGTTTSVAVVQHFRFGQPAERELRTPGVSMSSTTFGARRYMGLMAHLPLLMARSAREALLVCYGVGNTARSLLSHPSLERLEVVDISPEVLAQSAQFAALAGSDPLRDPRTHVFVEDGRQHILASRRRYDVITAEPPPPSNAGVVNLYSREYYAAARRVLAPGGVLAQWLPIFQLTSDETLAITAAMAAEFRWVGLFQGSAHQLVLLGSEAKPRIDLADWTRRSAQPPVERDLRGIGVLGVPDLLATFLQSDAGLRAVSSTAEPVTDDLPSLQYPTRAVLLPVILPAGLAGKTSDVLELVDGRPSPAFAAAAEATQIELRALSSNSLTPPELRELALGTAMHGALALLPGHPALLALLDLDPDSLAVAANALARDPSREDAAFALARRDFYTGQYNFACARLSRLHPGKEAAAQYWLVRAGCERALGQLQPAADSFRRSAAASSSEPFRALARALASQVAQPLGAEGPLALAAP